MHPNHSDVVGTAQKLSPFLTLIRERLFGTTTTNSIGVKRGHDSSNEPSDATDDINKVWRDRWDSAPDSWKHFVIALKKEYGMTQSEQDRITRRNKGYVETADLTRQGRLGTAAVALTVGTISKLMLRAMNTLHSHHLDTLHNAIEQRPGRKGLLTVSNHQSVMDDPFLLGAILPPRILVNVRKMRWGLCSMDICFQNAWVSRTLRLGKALPIQRRGGINQPFLREAAKKLADGGWVHIFPEGRVRQKGMGYFKRGIGKMLTMGLEDSQQLPMVLPMYHEGIERVMPQKEDSNDLESTIPKRGQTIYVVVGEPVDVSHIFDRLMPKCVESGGTKVDAPPCIKLYEEVADFLAVIMRLLRADARRKIKSEHDVDLGAPYEYS